MDENVRTNTRKLWIAALILVAVIAGLLFFINPFARDRMKVDQLRTIGKDEQESQSISSEFSQYVASREGIGKDIDSSLTQIKKTPAQSAPQTPFDTAGMDDDIAAAHEQFPWDAYKSEAYLESYNSLLLKF